MALTIPEVVGKLRTVDQAAQLAMYVNHRLVTIHEVIHVPETPYVFLCEKCNPASPSRRYTESENGLIGYCAANGIADDVVAQLMGREADAIKRQKKKLGW
jgi:hypothetical protein